MRKFIAKRLPSFYIDVPALRPGTVGAYALVVVSVGVATALRLALDPYPVGAQFVTFFPAVIITTLISGSVRAFFAPFSALLRPISSCYRHAGLSALKTQLMWRTSRCLARWHFPARCSLAGCALQSRNGPCGAAKIVQFALDVALLGWWQYDPRHGEVSGDGRFKEIFDVTNDQMPIEGIKKRAHPDDVERVWAVPRGSA
jgi:hypothetical protein